MIVQEYDCSGRRFQALQCHFQRGELSLSYEPELSSGVFQRGVFHIPLRHRRE